VETPEGLIMPYVLQGLGAPPVQMSMTPNQFALHILEVLRKLEGLDRLILPEIEGLKNVAWCGICRRVYLPGVATPEMIPGFSASASAGKEVGKLAGARKCSECSQPLPVAIRPVLCKFEDRGIQGISYWDLLWHGTDGAARIWQARAEQCAEQTLTALLPAVPPLKAALALTAQVLGADWASIVRTLPASASEESRLAGGVEVIKRLRRIPATTAKVWYKTVTDQMVAATRIYNTAAQIPDKAVLQQWDNSFRNTVASLGAATSEAFDALINSTMGAIQFVARTGAELVGGVAGGVVSGLFKGLGPILFPIALIVGGYVVYRVVTKRRQSIAHLESRS